MSKKEHKEYKLEIYFKQKRDMKFILGIIERFCQFAPEYVLKEMKEFGVVKVEHWHYVIERRTEH